MTMHIKNYRIFDRYMDINKFKYNKTAFFDDDMYFCKVWKGHRIGFKEICKDKNCEYAYMELNQRCIDYEYRILRYKYQAGQLTEMEYQSKVKDIERYLNY